MNPLLAHVSGAMVAPAPGPSPGGSLPIEDRPPGGPGPIAAFPKAVGSKLLVLVLAAVPVPVAAAVLAVLAAPGSPLNDDAGESPVV